jgi:zeaxanthin glucosyltransferase
MAKIAFVMLPTAGHLNPTFKLAKSLKQKGHQIFYLGLSSAGEHLSSLPESYVGGQGMEHVTVLRETLPNWGAFLNTRIFIEQCCRTINANREKVEERIRSIQPDLIVIDKLMLGAALLTVELEIQTIFLNTMLPVENLLSLAPATVGAEKLGALERLPELIVCPQELDFPRPPVGTRRYIEASVDLTRKESSFDWRLLSRGKPLIYCSLGTHNYAYQETRRFYQAAVEAMRLNRNYQMALRVGSGSEIDEFTSIPSNVLIVREVPQLELLKRASMMITHGGLGSVKECILLGVPMIVFPQLNDQPLNAARVVHHGLGLMDDVRKISADRIRTLIDQIDQNPSYKRRVESLGRKFKQIEQSGIGVKMIEENLTVKSAALAERA